MVFLVENEFDVPMAPGHRNLLDHISKVMKFRFGDHLWPIRLPTLAALEQGIPVIAVKENKNLMRNDLAALPWVPGQLHIVENYWEAVGVMSALRAGIAPESVRRPLGYTSTEVRSRDVDMQRDEEIGQSSSGQ